MPATWECQMPEGAPLRGKANALNSIRKEKELHEEGPETSSQHEPSGCDCEEVSYAQSSPDGSCSSRRPWHSSPVDKEGQLCSRPGATLA